MNELKIFYHKDYTTNLGHINGIVYQGQVLSKMNFEINKIDLSVLNPFVGKIADFYTLDLENKTTKHKQIEILRMESNEDMGWILHMDTYKDPETSK